MTSSRSRSASIESIDEIRSRWTIEDNLIVGHSDIAPDRKEDPGELFPWKQLAQAGHGDWVEVPVHRMEGLAPGYQAKGPAIFESDTTTVLMREGERVSVTPHGWLDIELG